MNNNTQEKTLLSQKFYSVTNRNDFVPVQQRVTVKGEKSTPDRSHDNRTPLSAGPMVSNSLTVPVYWPSEKAMAPHSRTLAWKSPWMEEPGRRQSMGSLRVEYD